MKKKEAARVLTREERRTLTLEGEAVLEYALFWPELEGGGLGGRWISHFCARTSKLWKQRWEREVYWRACLALAECRAGSRPFRPWRGELRGTVTRNQDGLLSIRWTGWEDRGDQRINRVQWGDVWNVWEGAPFSLRRLYKGKKGWKKELWEQLVRQGEQRRQGGDCFLDRDWIKKAKCTNLLRDYCLTGEGVEVSLPQGTAAPAAEGCPVFHLGIKSEKSGRPE